MEYKKYSKILIFDGSHALHRSISEPHLWEMRNQKGERTGGVFGTLKTIYKETKYYNYFPVVIFDGHLSKRRLNIFSNYKHYQDKQLLTESTEPQSEYAELQQEQRAEYNRQREILKELLPAFGIPVIHLADWEGDDLIYILSCMTLDSIVVSDDKDLIQLIHNDGSRRCRVKRAMRNEFLDYKWFEENNMTQLEYVARKALVGDPSDNIPSACFQVGEKTALGLFELYNKTRNNNINFPTTDQELTEICKKYDIPKRKAYLNFDENQFLNNMLLVDLSLVEKEITEPLLNEINNIIDSQAGKIDNIKAANILDNLNIQVLDSIHLLTNSQDKLPYLFDLNLANKEQPPQYQSLM